MGSNERATIVAASIGGICLCLAAVIGLFSPIMTRVTDRFLNPTATEFPFFTSTPEPTATRLVPPTETPSPVLVFVVYNNFDTDQDLYVDNLLTAAVDSGAYATLTVTRGSHLLTNCARGKNPQVNSTSCVGRVYDVEDTPFFWELPGNKASGVTAILLVGNTSSLDIDFFIDGLLASYLDRATYDELILTAGLHEFQACPRDDKPTNDPNNCGPSNRIDVQSAIQSWTIHD